MSEREQTPYPSGSRSAHDPTYRDDDWREHTTPGIRPVSGPTTAGPAGYGQAGEGSATTPQYSTQPVAVRKGDALAGLLLILAGIAAGVSLLLSWLPGDETRGWDILRMAFDTLGEGVGELFSSGFWQPMAILLGGGVLFVLGLLLLVPAKAHRFLGLLALLVSLAVAAGVLVPLADNGWALGEFRLGFWFAIAVAGLGLLGSLKALLSSPKYRSA
ncbi:hypothetical protein [Geodermatophilus sp. SYSU D00815]